MQILKYKSVPKSLTASHRRDEFFHDSQKSNLSLNVTMLASQRILTHFKARVIFYIHVAIYHVPSLLFVVVLRMVVFSA